MSEWGSNPIKKTELSEKEFKDLVIAIEKIGLDRKQAQGKIDEPDFFCGAMAVMERLGIGCPTWPLLMMSGNGILEEREKHAQDAF